MKPFFNGDIHRGNRSREICSVVENQCSHSEEVVIIGNRVLTPNHIHIQYKLGLHSSVFSLLIPYVGVSASHRKATTAKVGDRKLRVSCSDLSCSRASNRFLEV